MVQLSDHPEPVEGHERPDGSNLLDLNMFFSRIKTCTVLFFHFTRVFWQMLWGSWRLSKLQRPIVTIFGGSRFREEDEYFKHANTLAKMLVARNISVITGGGPGIMEAISCGAVPVGQKEGKSIGIGVTDLGEERNPCVADYIELDYFFARKWLLTNFSHGCIVFPGGFGTLDELFELLTLIQTKARKKMPIVLIGTEYWTPLLTWLSTEALKHKAILKEELELFLVTDDLEKACFMMCDNCIIDQPPPGMKKDNNQRV